MSESPESKSPETELGLTLDLHFLPSWAQESPSVNKYEKFSGEDSSPRGRRDDRRGGGGGMGPRRRSFGGPSGGGPGGGGPGAGRRDDQRRSGPGGPGGRDRQGGRDFRSRDSRPPIEKLPPLPEIDVFLLPEEKGVESLARQIRASGRAYPLFDIAHLVLKKAERFHAQLVPIKKADGSAPKLYLCALDDSIWLSEGEAVEHVLGKHFSTFYSVEKIATDAPKGTYTFVAQCGVSGVILGPPNYHDYQSKLRKLHAERFSRMPFEGFKSRIKIVKDEAIVKKWLEDQSFKNEYTCLNVPEPLRLNSREEVERHFREVHLPNVIRQVETHTFATGTAPAIGSRQIGVVLRRAIEDQTRFPLRLVNNLSQQFAKQGLQFFKVNKSITHVAVARPKFLDLQSTNVSEGIRRIVEFIEAHPGCTRRQLAEALVPVQTAPAAPAAPEAAPAEGEAPAPEAASTPSPEMSALISDLHWLVHQGNVIEFANGKLEAAKRPAPRQANPPRSAKSGQAAGAKPGPASEAEIPGEGVEESEHESDATPAGGETSTSREQPAQPADVAVVAESSTPSEADPSPAPATDVEGEAGQRTP